MRRVSKLIKDLADTPVALIRIENIPLFKFQRNGQPVTRARTLSLRDSALLDKYPELHTNPEMIIELLATLRHDDGQDLFDPAGPLN